MLPALAFACTDAAETNLSAASAELHALFLNATDYVIHHQEEVGRHFHVPHKLWPRIQRSWFRRHDDMVAGRFDLALTKTGLKAYEVGGRVLQPWLRAAWCAYIGSDIACWGCCTCMLAAL
jgi:glutathionylspermidine synthase